jgi:ABC-type branched-subunit amino acid transport system substrate-binding protein
MRMMIALNAPNARRFAVLGSVAALALAGCAQNRGSRPAPQAPRPAPARPVPPPQEKPAVPLPQVAAANRVAVLVPTSGPSAAVGQSIANAAQMALADLGEKRIAISVYNTAGPGGAGQAMREALSAGAGVVLGPLLAADVRAAAPIAREAGVPVLSFSNDAALAGSGVYVLGFQPGDSVERLVRFARSKGVERFAALTPAGDYGSRAATAYLRAVEAAGGRVTAVVTYTRDRTKLLQAARKVTDYEGRLARARGGQPTIRPDGTVVPATQRQPGPVPFQALLIADSGSIASAFTPALAQMGAGEAKIMGTELWAAEPGIARLPGLRGAWYASVPGGRFETLATRYRAKYGTTPSRLSSLGYDSVLLVAALANDWKPGAKFPVRGLADSGGFKGLDGIFRFDGGNIAERGYEVRQVGAGVVAPAPQSFGN